MVTMGASRPELRITCILPLVLCAGMAYAPEHHALAARGLEEWS